MQVSDAPGVSKENKDRRSSMIRWLLWVMTAWLLVKLALSAVIAQWFPLPPPNRPAWNTAKEEALAEASAAEDRASR
jgi:hypothetical protein